MHTLCLMISHLRLNLRVDIGISLSGIKAYVLDKYPSVDPNTLRVRVAKALDDCLQHGLIRKPESSGEQPAVLDEAGLQLGSLLHNLNHAAVVTSYVCEAYTIFTLAAQYVEQLGVYPSVCPVDRQQQRRVAGLLLSAPRPADIDRWQAPALSSKCGQR